MAIKIHGTAARKYLRKCGPHGPRDFHQFIEQAQRPNTPPVVGRYGAAEFITDAQLELARGTLPNCKSWAELRSHIGDHGACADAVREARIAWWSYWTQRQG